MSRRLIDWKAGNALTIGAVLETLIDSEDLPDDTTATLDIWLQGREVGTGELASGVFTHRAKKVGAAAPALVGGLIAIVTLVNGSDAGLAAAVVAVVVSGNKLRLEVTGVALKNIEWFADMRIRVN